MRVRLEFDSLPSLDERGGHNLCEGAIPGARAATVASWPLPAVAQQPAPGMKRLAFNFTRARARRARREFLVIQCKAPQGKAPEGWTRASVWLLASRRQHDWDGETCRAT